MMVSSQLLLASSSRAVLKLQTAAGVYLCLSRSISTTAPLDGKKNFRQIFLANKRGTRIYKQRKATDPDFLPDIPIYTDVKPPGYRYGKGFKIVPEMIPELIVPDLSDCKLKPYVTYRANDVTQEEFTAKSLFSFVYGDKIKKDFESGRIDGAGQPLELSPEETLSAEHAYLNARKTGSDIFSERVPEHWECLNLKKS